MSAWYLPLNAVGGELLEIPLSGAAIKGGRSAVLRGMVDRRRRRH